MFFVKLNEILIRDSKQELTVWNVLAIGLDNIAFSIRTMSTKDNYMLEEIRYSFILLYDNFWQFKAVRKLTDGIY